MNASVPGDDQSLLRPAVALPFLTVALIWGSTWWVITGQIDSVPAAWSVTWRFVLATPAMFALAAIMRLPLRIGRDGHWLAFLMGLTQFCGNYQFVYRSEAYLTSGIVALMISLMLLPNAVLARVLLNQPIRPRFAVGSAIAIAGIALLLLNESRVAPLGGKVLLGVALALAGMLCASIANVIQANDVGKRLPMIPLLAWAMLYGSVCDAGLAWIMSGPPVLPSSGVYWLGTAYLAIVGSVVTFPLYFNLVRKLGAGKAAYNGVAVVVIAMIISTVLEGYRWSLLAGAGAVLATAGLIVALSARRPST